MYQDKNGWTPLSDGLPEDGEECFVWYLKSFDGPGWCYTRYIDEKFDSVIGVTHWRPTFKPPIKTKRK